MMKFKSLMTMTMAAAALVLASCVQESFVRDSAPELKITVKATPMR